jgi:hypothetical protein
LKLKVETAERERDFYFEKLRDIEILCQAPELQEIPAIRIVERILYAADSGWCAWRSSAEKSGAGCCLGWLS